jgi:hypothetical protein
MADERPLPGSVVQASQMIYRAGGLGIWGAVLRFGGMPLEKIALLCVDNAHNRRPSRSPARLARLAPRWLDPDVFLFPLPPRARAPAPTRRRSPARASCSRPSS